MNKTEKIKEIIAWLDELTDEEVEKIFKPAIKPFIKKELGNMLGVGMVLGCLFTLGIRAIIDFVIAVGWI